MKIISHRGNTVKALKEAMKHDVDEIEFDVRVTGDDVPVLHHDPEFLSPKGEKIAIGTHTLKTILKNKPEVTTLQELFDVVDTHIPLYLEIKSGSPTSPIIKLIKQQLKKGRPAKTIRVASFSQKILSDIHNSLPELPLIVNESWSGVRATKRARALKTKTISMNQRWLWSGFVSSMSRHGYELYAYTINKPAKAFKFSRYGLKGVVTDFPDRFKAKH